MSVGWSDTSAPINLPGAAEFVHRAKLFDFRPIIESSAASCHFLSVTHSIVDRVADFRSVGSPHMTGLAFLILSLLPAFLQLVFQPLIFCAVWLPTIGARQPSKFTFCSLLTAAYPTWERSVHDEGWASGSNCKWWIDELLRTQEHA